VALAAVFARAIRAVCDSDDCAEGQESCCGARSNAEALTGDRTGKALGDGALWGSGPEFRFEKHCRAARQHGVSGLSCRGIIHVRATVPLWRTR